MFEGISEGTAEWIPVEIPANIPSGMLSLRISEGISGMFSEETAARIYPGPFKTISEVIREGQSAGTPR